MSVEHSFYFPEASGVLRITGADRGDFLQRQSTNDIQGLAPGVIVTTVLTNPSARILDVLTLWEMDADTIGALTLPGLSAATTQYLKGRIFFNDRVTVENASNAFSLLQVIGEGTPKLLERIGWPTPGKDGCLQESFRDHPVVLFGPSAQHRSSTRIVFPYAEMGTLLDKLESAGASEIMPKDYEKWRVEAGLPAVGSELNDSYTPLEIGLNALVSENKGCYTGQEVIARQITYDKVTKKLVGLRMAQEAVPGDRVLADGKPVGEVTSAVTSSTLGPIALAVLKRPHFEPGQPVEVARNSTLIQASTSALPFPK